MVDAALTTALLAVQQLIVRGDKPLVVHNGDCGVFSDTIRSIHTAYEQTFETTENLIKLGISTKDPHAEGIQDARDIWDRIIRVNMATDQPLIDAWRQTTAFAATEFTRKKRDLVEIIATIKESTDQNEQKEIALNLIDDAIELSAKELLKLADTMRQEFGFSLRWIADWKSAVREQAKKRREVASQLIPASEQSATDEQKLTWPYGIVDGRLVFFAQRADMFGGKELFSLPIADFNAKITRELLCEDGRKKFVVEGETIYGRPFDREILAEDFADTRKLKALMTTCAGAQSPINVGMEKHLGVAIQRVSREVATTKYFTRTGWNNGTFIIPGAEQADTIIALNRKQPYEFRADAKLDLGLEALEALLLSHTPQRCGPVLAFILTAPLSLFANWRNERYGMFIAGRTGSLKSSWSQAAMCLYGPDFIRDELLVKWGQGATNTAVMALAKSIYDLPFLIDNYKPNTGDGSRAFINLIHNIVEGGEKDRCFQTGELRESQPIFAWPMITGEDVPDQDPATLARILVVPFAKPKGDPVHLSKAQQLSEHLCAVGASWVQWIAHEGQPIVQHLAQRFVDARKTWGEELQKQQPDMVNVWRIASNLATNELTWAIAEMHPVLGPLLKKYGDEYWEGLQAIAKGMAAYTAETLEGTKFMDLLRQMLISEHVVLLKRGEPKSILDSNRMVGWQANDGGAYILMKLARTAIERHFGKECLNNLSDKTIYSQLIDLGYLIPGKDKATHPIKEGGVLHRVARFTKKAIGNEDTDNDSCED